MPVAAPPRPPTSSASTAEIAIVREINRVRRAHHLRTVKLTAPLARVARRHSSLMLKYNALSHSSFDGSSFSTRLQRAGKRRSYGETLAWAPDGAGVNAKSLLRLWLRSAPHRTGADERQAAPRRRRPRLRLDGRPARQRDHRGLQLLGRTLGGMPPRRAPSRASEPWRAREPSLRRRACPLAVAAVLAAIYLLVDPPSADLAAQTYRTWLFEHHGFVLWDNGWYGGHHIPAYSILFPPLAALSSPQLVGAVAAVVSAWAFERIVAGDARRRGRRPTGSPSRRWSRWSPAG